MQSPRLLVRTQAPGSLSSVDLPEVGLEPASEAGLVMLSGFSPLKRTVENGAGVSSLEHLQKELPGLSACTAEKAAGTALSWAAQLSWGGGTWTRRHPPEDCPGACSVLLGSVLA